MPTLALFHEVNIIFLLGHGQGRGARSHRRRAKRTRVGKSPDDPVPQDRRVTAASLIQGFEPEGASQRVKQSGPIDSVGASVLSFTLRQLEVFKTVAEQGSFRKSAQLLNTAQPALTRTIQALEHDLGVPLFRRTTRSVTLTAAGRELYSHANSVFERVEEIATSVRDVDAGRGGTVNLAYIDFAILGKLPLILENYRAINPRVKLNIRFASSSDQITLVKEGKTDVGFLLDVDAKLPNGFCRRQISLEPLVAVLPVKHRLADKEALSLGDLADEAFITGDTWLRFNQSIETLCHERNFSPRVTQKTFLRDEMLAFVMAGLGILVYPEGIRNAGLLGVKVVPITDVPPIIRTSAVWSAFSTNPVLPSFIRQITPA